jgi:hypothetical protein
LFQGRRAAPFAVAAAIIGIFGRQQKGRDNAATGRTRTGLRTFIELADDK